MKREIKMKAFLQCWNSRIQLRHTAERDQENAFEVSSTLLVLFKYRKKTLIWALHWFENFCLLLCLCACLFCFILQNCLLQKRTCCQVIIAQDGGSEDLNSSPDSPCHTAAVWAWKKSHPSSVPCLPHLFIKTKAM